MRVPFEHVAVFVLGDFNTDSGLRETALALRGQGCRVLAFGAGRAEAKRGLAAHEIDTDGVSRSRKRAAAALDGLFGVWDAMVVAAGWEDLIETIGIREREQAFLDLRPQRPLLRFGDPECGFLKAPEDWAAFAAARAAGAKPEDAKEFVRRQGGHKNKNRDGAPGGRDRAKAARKRAG